jgi:hypothetical protein
VLLGVANADASTGQPNPQSISFAPDGLEISYTVSTFQANFVRVAIVMWLKIAFLAMIAITTATFLAFPVACLVSFGCFLLAESSSFLATSLDYFNPDQDSSGAEKMGIGLVGMIGRPLTSIFRFYTDLSPMADLVEGRVVSWGTVGNAAAVMLGLCVALGLVGAMIFKNRELATYSGQ